MGANLKLLRGRMVDTRQRVLENTEYKECYYNATRKEQYLAKKEIKAHSTIDNAQRQYKNVAKKERELNKDICDWTLAEIIEYFKSLHKTSLDDLVNVKSYFSQYTVYCLSQSWVKNNKNNYEECTIDVLYDCLDIKLLDKKIISRKEILQWTKKLRNPRDQFILLSLFEYGNDSVDIYDAKQPEITSDTLALNKRTVKISRELQDIIAACKTEDTYYSMSEKEVKKMTLKDNGNIVKSYPNEKGKRKKTREQKKQVISNAYDRIFIFLNINGWMSAKDISESGSCI